MDGKPMNTNTIVGDIVQNNSKDWDSRICLSMNLLLMMEYILNPTIIVISTRIVMAWSWKRISCSIKGVHEFWKLIDHQEGITKEGLLIFRA